MLTVDNLTVTYPDKTCPIDGVSFTLNSGGSVALIGSNGAGKTTLLLALAGILPLAGGSIEVNGTALTKKTLHVIRKNIGLVFQNPDDQLFMPTIAEDVAFGPRNFDAPDVERIVADTLAALNIAHLAERSPLKLSGGEKRLAALAAVLAMEPGYLLLDEPTAFLDLKARRNLIGVLNRLPQGKLVATHDLTFAFEVCSRALMVKNGRITEWNDFSAVSLARLTAELESS